MPCRFGNGVGIVRSKDMYAVFALERKKKAKQWFENRSLSCLGPGAYPLDHPHQHATASSYFVHPLMTAQGSSTAAAAIAAASDAGGPPQTPEEGTSAPAVPAGTHQRPTGSAARVVSSSRSSRRVNPPQILQRLLGPAAAMESVQPGASTARSDSSVAAAFAGEKWVLCSCCGSVHSCTRPRPFKEYGYEPLFIFLYLLILMWPLLTKNTPSRSDHSTPKIKDEIRLHQSECFRILLSSIDSGRRSSYKSGKRSHIVETILSSSHLRTPYVPPDHLLLDSFPNLGPLVSRWEINKFKKLPIQKCHDFRRSKAFVPAIFNLSCSQGDVSGPILGDLSSNRWLGRIYQLQEVDWKWEM